MGKSGLPSSVHGILVQLDPSSGTMLVYNLALGSMAIDLVIDVWGRRLVYDWI